MEIKARQEKVIARFVELLKEMNETIDELEELRPTSVLADWLFIELTGALKPLIQAYSRVKDADWRVK